jgi:3-hydroxybutyryl-CoA dehydrogenase
MKSIDSIAVIGSGTMGSGIAQVCAQAGLRVILFDIDSLSLEKAKSGVEKNYAVAVEKGKMTDSEKKEALNKINISSNFADLKADLCIEAVIEKLEIKRELFERLAAQNDPDTILASNTSSIPITQIARGISNPERVIGIHFFNPAHLMKLVEIIAGTETSVEVLQASETFVLNLKKTPVKAKDAPGFIVNRVARHYYVESLKILEENITSFENIDKLMEATGFKMGPFRLMDLIGVDTNFSVTSSLYEQFFFDPKFRPSRIQKQKVDAGHWGKKSGKGFYGY